MKRLYISITSSVLRFFIKTLNRTYKVKIYGAEKVIDGGLLAFWHNSTFVMFDANPFKKMAILIAKGTQGEIFYNAVSSYPNRIIRVPFEEDSREATRSLIEMIKAINEGYSLGIAVDGPKGPLYTVKPGILFLAKKTKKNISTLIIEPERKIVLPFRWDKYYIPWPFTRICIYIDTYSDIDTEEKLKNVLLSDQNKAKELLQS